MLVMVGLLAPSFLMAKTSAISIPFVVQAPHGNWAQPYQDACEEAAITMLDAYYEGARYEHMYAWKADKEILDLVALEREVLGYDRDTDLTTIALLIESYFSFDAFISEDPSLQSIKQQIDQGRPVVVPAWGRDLVNPYFTPPGPTYHTIVVSGYDDEAQEFITQEPGTKRGRNFRYGYEDLMAAMSDFISDKKGLPMAGGPRRALFTSKTRLVKSSSSPRVYAVKSGKARHIVNEDVFIGSGYSWGDIEVVSQDELDELPVGLDVAANLR